MRGDAGVVIVGASLAGLTTAEHLRSAGYPDAITLIGAEHHDPYSRPPLSKQLLRGWDPARTILRSSDEIAGLGIRFIRGRAATSVNRAARTVTVGDEAVPFRHLVAATGVTARRLQHGMGVAGVHAMRTVDDAEALRRDLPDAAQVVVVGAGVLGCEIAAALQEAGHRVTLVGRTHAPRLGDSGSHVAHRVDVLLRENGVRMRMNAEVIEVVGRERVSAVRLTDGSVVPADAVVVAIGSIPSVAWLRGAGLDLSDGILCDAHGVAGEGIYAVGDVARWHDPVSDEAVRSEHQTTAIEQATAVAHLIATGNASAPIAPFFWTELFGTKVFVHGRLDRHAPLTTLAGDAASPHFVAATIRDGRTTGIVGWNMPREFRQERLRVRDAATQVAPELKGIPA